MKKEIAYINPYRSPVKTRSCHSVYIRFIIFVIPIIIAVLVITMLMLALQQLTHATKTEPYLSENTSAQVSFYSDSDSDKLLTVVSVKSPLPTGYMIHLENFDGIMIDRIVVSDLKRMLNDCQNAGLHLQVIAGYVSTEEQNELYYRQVKKLTEEGYSREEAEIFAEISVPMGNHDDRQSGLSVTFNSPDGDFLHSDEYHWLMLHAHQYGFIQRYPENSSEYTSMWFTPELFRYVGTANAGQMKLLNMCLEQYTAYLQLR